MRGFRFWKCEAAAAALVFTAFPFYFIFYARSHALSRERRSGSRISRSPPAADLRSEAENQVKERHERCAWGRLLRSAWHEQQKINNIILYMVLYAIYYVIYIYTILYIQVIVIAGCRGRLYIIYRLPVTITTITRSFVIRYSYVICYIQSARARVCLCRARRWQLARPDPVVCMCVCFCV
jgi:hypothetical protein